MYMIFFIVMFVDRDGDGDSYEHGIEDEIDENSIFKSNLKKEENIV